jgi:DNA polymerase elongation subunit (family B)
MKEIRLVDFNIKKDREYSEGEVEYKNFEVQMFGLDAKGRTYCLNVSGFKPYFYIRVADDWTEQDKKEFLRFIINRLRKEELNKLYKKLEPDMEKSLFIQEKINIPCAMEEFFLDERCKIVNQKKLYGFDAGKKYNFIKLVFGNQVTYNKVMKYWYNNPNSFKKKKLMSKGLEYDRNGENEYIRLYEAKLPSLLRLFHVKDITPSGWISINEGKYTKKKKGKTLSKFNFNLSYKDIIPLPNKETPVPYKICSYDIEASSSHGDFPLALKTYRKMLGEIITYWNKEKKEIIKMSYHGKKDLFQKLVLSAFRFDNMTCMSEVYPKNLYWKTESGKGELIKVMDRLLSTNEKGAPKFPLGRLLKKKKKVEEKDKRLDEEDNDEEINMRKKKWLPFIKEGIMKILMKNGILYCLSYNFEAGNKLGILDRALDNHPDKENGGLLPELEGDKCTFIGSTFLRAGEVEPYLNHCVVLNTCDETKDVRNSVIETYDTEAEMLIGWRNIIQKEDPDIIIGYNIFGFDYIFMHTRAEEVDCVEEFMKLSRNTHVKCKLVNKQIKIASGTHDLTYIDMPGRIQVDLYNHFRREINLPSYKLDYVASHFIGDFVKEVTDEENGTKLKSYNLTGLQKHNFVSFELIGHSSDSFEFKGKKKFKVIKMKEKEGWFMIKEKVIFEEGKKIRWGLAKDDVTPHDIFRLTNEGPTERAIIAKYCFQDCNLVQHIFRKNDILTGFIEIANVCSVPIDYIVMRGQGIKLLSFLGKQCREKGTLMPVMEKIENDGSYEGAICLPPKKGLYLDNPIAVVDYSSLYPSSMISDNISHDSKVWTKEYDLNGRMLKKTGTDEYDNLTGYKYVNITYDTYEWKRENQKKKEVKIKVGYKTCRFAQFPGENKGILPDILMELLSARKATRRKAKYKTVKTKDNTYIGILEKGETHKITTEKNGIVEINNDDVISVEDTFGDYMKNVFDKRQQGIKVTANSMYGQCGARTSAFYEKDIAASTTAMGRKLLLYGKKVIEDVYRDTICETKYGKVRTKSDVIYGDTDSAFFSFNLEEIDGTKIKGKRALEITIDLAIEAGKVASKFLKAPHDLEYEKTFMPFCLLSKKRYVGMLYEKDPNKCKRKSMGIVLKRRDNAPIVKDIYGGLIDILMKEQSIEKAIKFTKDFLEDIVNEKFSLDKLIVSKSIRGFYAKPESIAHWVLADRIGKRDPGNKPQTGARIPYVFIQTKKKIKLQGDKIENPGYIKEHKLKPDYIHYITNQIMKPVQQVFGLVLGDIKEFKPMKNEFDSKMKSITFKYRSDEAKLESKKTQLVNKFVKKLIFDKALRKATNLKNNQLSIKSFFS